MLQENTKMNYSIHIDHQNKIIHYQHKGVIGTDDIGSAWQEFLQMKEFTEQKYNLLSDYSEAHFDMKVKDVGLITDFLLTLKPVLQGKKQAIIIDEPFNTAISLLFEGQANSRIGFKVCVFSGEKAAKKWLML